MAGQCSKLSLAALSPRLNQAALPDLGDSILHYFHEYCFRGAEALEREDSRGVLWEHFQGDMDDPAEVIPYFAFLLSLGEICEFAHGRLGRVQTAH